MTNSGNTDVEPFPFHRVRYMYTTNRTWRKVAIAVLIILCILVAAAIAALLWYFLFRVPDKGYQKDESNPSDGSSSSTPGGGPQPYQGCFPPDSTIITPTGRKRMDELVIGDEVLDLNANGQPVWTKVYAFSFYDNNQKILTRITAAAENGHVAVLRATPNHLIFRSTKSILPGQKVSTAFEAVQASEVVVGDHMLVKINGSEKYTFAQVTDAQSVTGVGARSPITYTGSIVADDVWVSCFAGSWLNGLIGHDFLQNYAFAPLRYFAQLLETVGVRWSFIDGHIFTAHSQHLWYVKFLKCIHSLADTSAFWMSL